MNEVELRFVNPKAGSASSRRIPSGTQAADLLPELGPGEEILAVKINNQYMAYAEIMFAFFKQFVIK